MKKIAVILSVLMLAVCFTGCKKEDGAKVFVAVTNGEIMTAGDVKLTDTDGDGKLTVADALYEAHEEHFDGGAAAGFKAENTDYGLSLALLWGVDNGGAYGYYHNNESAMSLADEVKDGDSVCAYIYQDTQTWSDMYTYFDVNAQDGKLELTLNASTFDESFAPVTAPVGGAVITVNGEKTDAVTDENGRAQISVSAGDTVSAVYSDAVIVPPVYVVD